MRAHHAGNILHRFEPRAHRPSAPAVEELSGPVRKLEQQGWISAEWQNTENNRRAKVYSLTPPGSRYLRQEAANWERLSQAITHVVRLTEA